MNYSILLLDDDKLILEYLTKTIKDMFSNVDTISYGSYDEYLKNKESIKYDIVITDIIFGDVNSIDVYKVLSDNSKIPLIYMSGNDTRTFDVYDTPHIYFLAKPIDEERLKKAIERAMDSNKFFTFDYFKKSYSVNFKEIMYFESDRRLIHIVTKKNIYQTYGKLDDIVSRLPSYFLRVSKSFIINKNYIKEWTSQEVTLINGETFSISRQLKKDFERAL